MRTIFKFFLLLTFSLLIASQLKSFAIEQSQLKDKYSSHISKAQKLLTKREISTLELQYKLLRILDKVKDVEDTSKRLTSLQTAIIEDPNSTKKERIKSKESLAELRLKDGNIQEAYNLALEALQQQPKSLISSGILFVIAQNKADEYIKQSQFDEAISEYQNLLRLDLSESYLTLTEFQIANIYRDQEDYPTAIKLYQELIDNHLYLANWCSFAQYQIVDIYYSSKRTSKAKEELNKLLTKYTYTPWAKAALNNFRELLR